ncbi:hypothetical protein [Roseovarius confluentis]|uniref:hypothetical protein n=1 Tax=Roseovarius confluentis TaxID=1852027 RepID=UPI000CDD6126|nr:hypothetical protein [Roseovarius confluentis]
MGRNTYLGGSTIESARTDANHLDNTTPQRIPEEPDRAKPMIVPLDRDLSVEVAMWDFDTVAAWLAGFDHAFRHGDLTAIPKLEAGDAEYENYLLRIANRLMENRKFQRVSGHISIQRNGKLGWRRDEFRSFVEGVKHSAQEIDAEMPELSPELTRFLDGE